MSIVDTDQVEAVRRRIMELGEPSVAPASVEVTGLDGSDGAEAVVTVRLKGDDQITWDPQAFLAVRRAARTVAFDILGPDRDVRMVYESATTPDDDSSGAGATAGDKRAAGES